jgi:(E)-4-hydroxy-3-methylbut-2-enyl-diphosphate synthase
MTNTPTQDVAATVAQIRRLEAAGCEIVRVAVPDEDAAAAVAGHQGRQIAIPLIADIHFDHRLALAAAGTAPTACASIRATSAARRKVQAVVDCARDLGLPIRIGVNAGSLEKDSSKNIRGATPAAMVESALRHVGLLEKPASTSRSRFRSRPRMCRAPWRPIACWPRATYPLHLGVTEAGSLFTGTSNRRWASACCWPKASATRLRVSLTRDPVEEVRVGFEILKALDIRRRGPEIIACPTCGRMRHRPLPGGRAGRARRC